MSTMTAAPDSDSSLPEEFQAVGGRLERGLIWVFIVVPTLALAGSLALEGPVVRWVADHRKHHKFSDREGDPHSPWRYGTTAWAVTKGFVFAHAAWLPWG